MTPSISKATIQKMGFCIYIDSLCDGLTPVEFGADGKPVIYGTALEAQRVIAEDIIERLHQFLAGEREFEDAITIEERVVEIGVLHDGTILETHSYRL